MNRWHYRASIAEFLASPIDSILGTMSQQHREFDLTPAQSLAWRKQAEILKTHLQATDKGEIAFEYVIPRMGKRVDAILIFGQALVVVEFKVGATHYESSAIDQVMDYALDLKNFHEKTHDLEIVPLLVATEASASPLQLTVGHLKVWDVLRCNGQGLRDALLLAADKTSNPPISADVWFTSPYRPTPTIIEASVALYRGHKVEDISRSDAGAENLTKTASSIASIVDDCRRRHLKAICFITGVPGAGKTLAGLNIATQSQRSAAGEHAVFLSGNGPLVKVLQESLARDQVLNMRERGSSISKADARRQTGAFVQQVHHFRDEGVRSADPPADRVVIFDEAQRAWNRDQTVDFMARKKGVPNFNRSEPEFLIEVMNRHKDWAVIVCLVGEGQEINKGEAGLSEWFNALQSKHRGWKIFSSSQAVLNCGEDAKSMLNQGRVSIDEHLHLSVSVRSFRAEKLSHFVGDVLSHNADGAQEHFDAIKQRYPIVLTRNLASAREWVRSMARGSERYGLLASSKGLRLKAHGVFVESEINPVHYFLGSKDDARSCYFLEDTATEFHVQGLELDWSVVMWDGDLRVANRTWNLHEFKGMKWNKVHKADRQNYRVNAYRVLLTRARQGMVIVVPEGSNRDPSRHSDYYDPVFKSLRSLGIPTI